jgi:hypothetical protein
MNNTSTTSPTLQSEAETTVHLLDNWFDAIEVGLREMPRMMMDRKVSPATATVTARDH